MSVTIEDLNKQAEKIAELRAKEAEASQTKRAITSDLEQAELVMLQMLEANNLTSYISPHGRLGLSYRTSVKTPKTVEEKEAFYKYLREKGIYDAMISVNSQKLNAFYKEEFELAKERGDADFSIPGINEVTMNPILSFTRK